MKQHTKCWYCHQNSSKTVRKCESLKTCLQCYCSSQLNDNNSTDRVCFVIVMIASTWDAQCRETLDNIDRVNPHLCQARCTAKNGRSLERMRAERVFWTAQSGPNLKAAKPRELTRNANQNLRSAYWLFGPRSSRVKRNEIWQPIGRNTYRAVMLLLLPTPRNDDIIAMPRTCPCRGLRFANIRSARYLRARHSAAHSSVVLAPCVKPNVLSSHWTGLISFVTSPIQYFRPSSSAVCRRAVLFTPVDKSAKSYSRWRYRLGQ